MDGSFPDACSLSDGSRLTDGECITDDGEDGVVKRRLGSCGSGSVATLRRARLRRRARTRAVGAALCALAAIGDDIAGHDTVFGRHLAQTLLGPYVGARTVKRDVLPLPPLDALPDRWPPDCGTLCRRPLRVLTNVAVAGLNYVHAGCHPRMPPRDCNTLQRQTLHSIAPKVLSTMILL